MQEKEREGKLHIPPLKKHYKAAAEEQTVVTVCIYHPHHCTYYLYSQKPLYKIEP